MNELAKYIERIECTSNKPISIQEQAFLTEGFNLGVKITESKYNSKQTRCKSCCKDDLSIVCTKCKNVLVQSKSVQYSELTEAYDLHPLKLSEEHLQNCKHIKRESESCMLNDNCVYPNCPT